MKKLIFTLLFTLACAAIFSAAPTKKDFDEWNSLTEDERMLCLLTDPYIATNGLKTTSVNPEPNSNGETSMELLENGWESHSIEDLLQWFVPMQNGICRIPYKKVKELYDKYPGSTVEEIAIAECLNFTEITYLIFYADNHEKLGEHAFLALDALKLLTPLRYAVAVNWISEQEAVEFAKPVMDEVRNAFYSYEDFIVHLAVEQSIMSFFGAYGDDIESHNKKDIPFVLARYAKPSASKYAINYDIKFPAQKQNGNPILTYDDIFYVPDEEALKLYALVKWLYRRTDSYSKAEEKKIRTIIEEKKYIPAVAFLGILDDSVDVNRENLDEYLKIFDNEKKHLYITWHTYFTA